MPGEEVDGDDNSDKIAVSTLDSDNVSGNGGEKELQCHLVFGQISYTCKVTEVMEIFIFILKVKRVFQLEPALKFKLEAINRIWNRIKTNFFNVLWGDDHAKQHFVFRIENSRGSLQLGKSKKI